VVVVVEKQLAELLMLLGQQLEQDMGVLANYDINLCSARCGKFTNQIYLR